MTTTAKIPQESPVRRALITGINGQDGFYMAEYLTAKGYEIHGVVRENTGTNWLQEMFPEATFHHIDLLDKSTLQKIIISVHPTEIYNFAGVSDVFSAWTILQYTIELNAMVPLYILETIRDFDKNIKFFQASSCLIFGRDGSGLQNEKTPDNPIHPYGISKLMADNFVREFRHVFGLYACSGIFFTHESPRRGERFFSKKVISAVARIKNGSTEKLMVGNLDALRDFGFSPDFMEAAYLIMQQTKAEDYVIGTGNLISMHVFVEKCFTKAGLNYKDHVVVDPELYRANDTKVLKADITKIKRTLGWYPKHNVDEMISIMLDAEIKRLPDQSKAISAHPSDSNQPDSSAL